MTTPSKRIEKRCAEIQGFYCLEIPDKPLLRIAKLMVEREMELLNEIPYSVYNDQWIKAKINRLDEELTEINNRLK